MINKVDLDKLLKSKKISQSTYDKVIIAKQIIEQKYNMKNIKNTEMNQIFSKIDSLNISQSQKEQIKQEIHSQESAKYRKLREKQSIRDYTSLAIIGRGAFGEVHVCREKKTGQIVAVKKIRKDVLKIKNQVIHVRNEQLFMSKVKSPWIVELKASFQEDDYLYLVMEYLPGGDFMNLLIKKDILTEDEAKFYTAELILAIENIHKLDCIHRDIKPDNVLIDKTGHIKLSDFGLAKVSPKIFEINNNNENIDFKPDSHQKNYSCVGTAYYVAPEVLKKKGYGPEVDWWSVGVIFFEMLFGYAPFHSKETNQVCHKVLNWQKYLVIPSKIKISKEAEDLIWKLINNSNQRLGIGGAEEIKKHPFFKDVDWDNIRNTKAPFIPRLKNDYDTHYFETLEEKEPFYPNRFNKKQKRKDIEFMGYTFKEGDFNEFNLENEFLNSIEGIKYINRDKSNGESFDHSSNSSSNLENGGKNKSNGIDKNVNNIPIHLENKISNENNEDNNKFLITKRLNKSKEKINKIKINNDNNNNIIYSVNNISDKASILSKQNTTMHTISYNKSPQSNSNNNNIIATSSKKFKKKINICINSNNSSNNNDNIFLNDKFNMTKNLKTEPNSNINKESSIRNYFEYQNNHNHSNKNNNTKLNVIQLPTKKISTNKIIIKENGASIPPSNSNPKYDIKKNLISSSLNKKKYFPNRYSPQPNEILFKKFLILKSKSKKKNLANYPPLSKSSEKGVTKKNHLFKSIINQNAIKKKYIGINSAKSIFAEKKNTQNNNLNNLINSNNDIYYNNCMTERKFTLTNQNEKVSYIYQKKL
jgi:serine/threonine kinase 38